MLILLDVDVCDSLLYSTAVDVDVYSLLIWLYGSAV